MINRSVNDFRNILCTGLYLLVYGLAACVDNSTDSQAEEAVLESSSATSEPSLSDCGDLLHFRLIGLKDLYRADICLEDGGRIKGKFHIFDDYSDSPTTTTTFEGRLDGKRIEVQFLSGKAPYPTSPDSAPSEDSSVIWHLDVEPPATRKLIFDTYGKDYERDTWRSYSAQMERARLVPGKSLLEVTSSDLEAIATP